MSGAKVPGNNHFNGAATHRHRHALPAVSRLNPADSAHAYYPDGLPVDTIQRVVPYQIEFAGEFRGTSQLEVPHNKYKNNLN